MLKIFKFSDGHLKVITDMTGQKMKKTFKTEDLFREWFESATNPNPTPSVRPNSK